MGEIHKIIFLFKLVYSSDFQPNRVALLRVHLLVKSITFCWKVMFSFPHSRCFSPCAERPASLTLWPSSDLIWLVRLEEEIVQQSPGLRFFLEVGAGHARCGLPCPQAAGGSLPWLSWDESVRVRISWNLRLLVLKPVYDWLVKSGQFWDPGLGSPFVLYVSHILFYHIYQ